MIPITINLPEPLYRELELLTVSKDDLRPAEALGNALIYMMTKWVERKHA